MEKLPVRNITADLPASAFIPSSSSTVVNDYVAFDEDDVGNDMFGFFLVF